MVTRRHVAFHLIVLVILVATTLAVSLASNASAANAQDADLTGPICHGVRIRGETPAPPAGFVATQTFTFNADCTVTEGPVEFVSVLGVPIFDGPSCKADLPTSGALGSGDQFNLWIDQRIADSVDITLNQLYGKDLVSSDPSVGPQISGYQADGYYDCHHEDSPAGEGWTPLSPENDVWGGGQVGDQGITLHQGIDFSYKGLFDPTGSLYHTKVDNYGTLYYNGSASCSVVFEGSYNPLLFKEWMWACGQDAGS